MTASPAPSELAPLPTARPAMFGPPRARKPINPSRIARRRRLVALAKRLLPAAALGLLAIVALWPELSRDADQRRLSLQQGNVQAESGQMIDATYHSVDERGRPYTLTATHASEVRPGAIELTDPKADLTQENGGWLLVDAHNGVYQQREGNVDMWGEVQLYRDDGTTLTTNSANIDLKSGAAAGAEMVHVEGPFGTLDAQGFAVTDRGAVTQFSGPGRLVLNARSK